MTINQIKSPKNSGVTLIEMLIAGALFASVLLLGGKSLLQLIRQSSMITEKLDMESRTFALTRHLTRVIRFADTCNSVLETVNFATTPPTVTSPGSVSCEIVMETPRTPASVPVKVRFIHDADLQQVNFQTQQGAGGFATTLFYPRISEFFVCSDAHMSSGACLIKSGDALQPHATVFDNNKINTVHNASLAGSVDFATPPNHFFHFLVTALMPATLETGGANFAQGTTVAVQGSVYMLNKPVRMIGLPPLSPVAFQSGGKIID